MCRETAGITWLLFSTLWSPNSSARKEKFYQSRDLWSLITRSTHTTHVCDVVDVKVHLTDHFHPWIWFLSQSLCLRVDAVGAGFTFRSRRRPRESCLCQSSRQYLIRRCFWRRFLRSHAKGNSTRGSKIITYFHDTVLWGMIVNRTALSFGPTEEHNVILSIPVVHQVSCVPVVNNVYQKKTY